MGTLNNIGKIISVYSNLKVSGKTEYAINLAAAIASVTKKKVVFVEMASSFEGPLQGMDVLLQGYISIEELDALKKRYDYIIINLPFMPDNGYDKLFELSESVHYFIDSVEENLKDAGLFFKTIQDNESLIRLSNKIKIVVNRLRTIGIFDLEEITWLIKKDVWAIVPESSTFESIVDQNGKPIVLRSVDSPYSKAVLYIAKKETGMLLGLALGSGAAFGLAHIGVLRVIEENNITVDVLSGSSMGALIACMWGLGISSDEIEEIARRLRNKLNIMRLLDFSIPISGILRGQRLKRFLKNILGEKTFEDLKIPVKIIVYDLTNRETLIIEKGLLVDAVFMSISVPGIFKPEMLQNSLIIDGGISDPVPVDALLKEGVRKIIAVNVIPGPEDICSRNVYLKKKLQEEENIIRNSPLYIRIGLYIIRLLRKVFTPNIFDVIMSCFQAMEYILAEDSCRKADVVLRPIVIEATPIDFHLVKDFIRCGEEEARKHISEIKRLSGQ